MARSYVAIYQNKNLNYALYYDFRSNEIFTTEKQQNQLMVTLISFAGGFVGIVFYSIMKNVSFDLGLNPIHMLTIAALTGIILTFISIILLNRVIEKRLEYSKIVIHPTKKELREYLSAGEKQSKGLIFMLLMLFLLVFASGLFLYFKPQSVLMFLVNIIFWFVSIFATWALNPIKRFKAHKQLKEHLEFF